MGIGFTFLNPTTIKSQTGHKLGPSTQQNNYEQGSGSGENKMRDIFLNKKSSVHQSGPGGRIIIPFAK